MTGGQAPSLFPHPRESDPEDVAWALSTAEALWKRGEYSDALSWIRRAATAAAEADADMRVVEIAKAVAELSVLVSVEDEVVRSTSMAREDSNVTKMPSEPPAEEAEVERRPMLAHATIPAPPPSAAKLAAVAAEISNSGPRRPLVSPPRKHTGAASVPPPPRRPKASTLDDDSTLSDADGVDTLGDQVRAAVPSPTKPNISAPSLPRVAPPRMTSTAPSGRPPTALPPTITRSTRFDRSGAAANDDDSSPRVPTVPPAPPDLDDSVRTRLAAIGDEGETSIGEPPPNPPTDSSRDEGRAFDDGANDDVDVPDEPVEERRRTTSNIATVRTFLAPPATRPGLLPDASAELAPATTPSSRDAEPAFELKAPTERSLVAAPSVDDDDGASPMPLLPSSRQDDAAPMPLVSQARADDAAPMPLVSPQRSRPSSLPSEPPRGAPTIPSPKPPEVSNDLRATRVDVGARRGHSFDDAPSPSPPPASAYPSGRPPQPSSAPVSGPTAMESLSRTGAQPAVAPRPSTHPRPLRASTIGVDPSRPRSTIAKLLDPERFEPLADVPDDALEALVAHAEVVALLPDERADAPVLVAVVAGALDLLSPDGAHVIETIPIGGMRLLTANEPATSRLLVAGGAKGARYVALDLEALRTLRATAPWVVQELESTVDQLHVMAGALGGKLSTRLHGASLTHVLSKGSCMRLRPGAMVVREGEPVRALIVVGAGELSQRAGSADGSGDLVVLGAGALVFGVELLARRPAPCTLRAGPSGALVLVATRATTEELLSTTPLLVEILGEG